MFSYINIIITHFMNLLMCNLLNSLFSMSCSYLNNGMFKCAIKVIRGHETVFNWCLVSWQSNVRSPKCTRHVHTVQWSPDSGRDVIKPVELVIETAASIRESYNRSRSNSGNTLLIHRERIKMCYIELSFELFQYNSKRLIQVNNNCLHKLYVDCICHI